MGKCDFKKMLKDWYLVLLVLFIALFATYAAWLSFQSDPESIGWSVLYVSGIWVVFVACIRASYCQDKDDTKDIEDHLID